MGRKYLRKKGRLVFLFPSAKKDKNLVNLWKKENDFKLISISENGLSSQLSRYLITFEKLWIKQLQKS